MHRHVVSVRDGDGGAYSEQGGGCTGDGEGGFESYGHGVSLDDEDDVMMDIATDVRSLKAFLSACLCQSGQQPGTYKKI